MKTRRSTLSKYERLAIAMLVCLSVGFGTHVNAQSLLPLPSGTSTNGRVNAIAVQSDGQTIIAGMFTAVNGVGRSNIARLKSDGSLDAWNPGSNGEIYSLAASAGIVYAGGSFTHIGGQSRSHLAALNATTGFATAWNPNPNAIGSVDAIVVSGNSVFVGGSFAYFNDSIVRFGLAQIDANTGVLTAWDPAGIEGTGFVKSLAISGNTIYVGGTFDKMGGMPRAKVAAVDISSGLATAWNPGSDGVVDAIAVSGNTIFVGGSFTGIGGQPRKGIAALNSTTGAATSWDVFPQGNGDPPIVKSLVVAGSILYAGGNFIKMGGLDRASIAAIDSTTGVVAAWAPEATGIDPLWDFSAFVNAIAINANSVYIGGTFEHVLGQSRKGIAAITREQRIFSNGFE